MYWMIEEVCWCDGPEEREETSDLYMFDGR